MYVQMPIRLTKSEISFSKAMQAEKAKTAMTTTPKLVGLLMGTRYRMPMGTSTLLALVKMMAVLTMRRGIIGLIRTIESFGLWERNMRRLCLRRAKPMVSRYVSFPSTFEI